jgi:outer membrane protein OmpA-like peptidoglycan-associated protein
VAGHGEADPVARNTNTDGTDNPRGRALNRRVEISFPKR